MKILALKDLVTPLLFKAGKFTGTWSKQVGNRLSLTNSTMESVDEICCIQEAQLKFDHVADRLQIVQLSSEEAAQLGLRNALGAIIGKRLA